MDAVKEIEFRGAYCLFAVVPSIELLSLVMASKCRRRARRIQTSTASNANETIYSVTMAKNLLVIVSSYLVAQTRTVLTYEKCYANLRKYSGNSPNLLGKVTCDLLPASIAMLNLRFKRE
jgi:hypothetical protein